MEEGAKKRLVGAAVIVLLLVVFVPMLLEEDTQGPAPESELAVPERPGFDQGYDATVTDGPHQADSSAPAEAVVPESPALPQELPPPVLFDAPAVAPSEPAYEPAEEPVPILVEEAPSASAPEPVPASAPASKPPPATKPAPAPIPAGVSSWVIQVASVQDQKRAKSLESDLREKGFPAFIQQAEVKQKLWHRIRVGPEADRKRAESIAASIKAQTGLNVQIQRYP